MGPRRISLSRIGGAFNFRFRRSRRDLQRCAPIWYHTGCVDFQLVLHFRRIFFCYRILGPAAITAFAPKNFKLIGSGSDATAPSIASFMMPMVSGGSDRGPF